MGNKFYGFKTNCINVTNNSIVNSVNDYTVYWGKANLYKDKLTFFLNRLSIEEQQRAKRFVFDADRLTYCVSHFLLRSALSDFLKVLYKKIEIRFIENSKPYINDIDVDFNLSHSKDYFCYSVVNKSVSLIGVDIEVIKPIENLSSIVTNYMHSKEEAYILNKSISNYEQMLRFYEIWTRKEALLKMHGIGITTDLQLLNLIPGTRTNNIEISNILEVKDEVFIYTFFTSEFVLSISSNLPRIPILKQIENSNK